MRAEFGVHHTAMTDKPARIEIFRTSTHTGTNGAAVTMSTADLGRVVGIYICWRPTTLVRLGASQNR